MRWPTRTGPWQALPLLTADEHRQVATEWNATELPAGDGALVHERLAAQAARTPTRSP